MTTSTTATPPALRPEDYLDLDSLLSDTERDIHALVVGAALTGIQAFRG